MVTPLQHRVYEFVCAYIREHHYSPTLEEIAVGMGISPRSISLINRCLRALATAGRLSLAKGGYRNIRLATQDRHSLPLLGYISHDAPFELAEDSKLDVSPFLNHEKHFAIEVKGASLQEEGVFPGDFIICQHTERAAEGDFVFALVHQRLPTLKRISYQIPGRITLISGNAQSKPRAYFPDQVHVQGVFVGLFRPKK